MYPGTKFNWYDQSEFVQQVEPASIDNKPLFMVVSSFDKGPEDLIEVVGDEFAQLYGKMYFDKHGQNAIQAQRIINAGARLLVKRVCAPDSTIANLVLTAKLTSTTAQKKDEDGNLVYLNEAGEEVTTVTDRPVNITSASIKWEASSIENCKSFKEVKEAALKKFDAETGTFPLFIFSDNGRGVSNKAIRLIPDYSTSKNIGKMFYSLAVYEGTASIETQPMTFDPAVVYSNVAYCLDESTSVQVKGIVDETVYESFIKAIADILSANDPSIDESVIRNYDLVYGYNVKGSKVEGLNIDAESVDINANYGIEIKKGTNGKFGDTPGVPNFDKDGTIAKDSAYEAWAEAIRAVYAGEVTDEVWDVDQHKIAAVCDANLPIIVTEAIAKFVSFRQDCVFFRDLGTGLNSYAEIQSAWLKHTTRNRFIADFGTSYQVKDPVTKKNIEVTCMYDLVECLVNHFDSGAYAPLAGTVNGFVLRDAIKGTINFTPIITPVVNQKQAMDDIKVNYAIFEEDQCVVQTEYTSQDLNSQLSFINNVLAIQEVARAVRTACPKNRHTFTTSLDMSSYAKSVNNVLVNFASNFETLSFEYTQDQLRTSQKIFYASIKFSFGSWFQTEIFDLFAINNQ